MRLYITISSGSVSLGHVVPVSDIGVKLAAIVLMYKLMHKITSNLNKYSNKITFHALCFRHFRNFLVHSFVYFWLLYLKSDFTGS